MFCRYCGTRNADTAAKCVKCGSPMSQMQQQQQFTPGQQQQRPPPHQGQGGQIPNYLVAAILTTACCCVPFGIVAIIYAAQVNTKLAQGDVQGALYASKKAKMWIWIALGAGALLVVASLAVQTLALVPKH